MFKETPARSSFTDTVYIEFYTEAPGELEPGKYWVGPLDVIFPKGYNSVFPVAEMIHEAIQQQADDGATPKGAMYAYGSIELPFLIAPAGKTRFESSSEDNPAASWVGSFFRTNDWVVLVPVNEVTAPNPKQWFELACHGMIVTIHKPVKPVLSLNSVELMYMPDPDATLGDNVETVFETTGQ